MHSSDLFLPTVFSVLKKKKLESKSVPLGSRLRVLFLGQSQSSACSDPESELCQCSHGSWDHPAGEIWLTCITCRNDFISTLLFPIWTVDGRFVSYVDECGWRGSRAGQCKGSQAQRSGSQHCSASMKPSFSWPTGSTSAYAGYPEPRRNFMAGHRLGRLYRYTQALCLDVLFRLLFKKGKKRPHFLVQVLMQVFFFFVKQRYNAIMRNET